MAKWLEYPNADRRSFLERRQYVPNIEKIFVQQFLEESA